MAEISSVTRTSSDPPIIRGIQLVPTSNLPDHIRNIFPYRVFNAVQSKCFQTVYSTDDNFVLASPTASGKTAVLELAICRLVQTSTDSNFKIIYQAPTKALCSERQRDWGKKFGHLQLKCVEATGDSEFSTLKSIQHAQIIITTPEKWDSLTRKWRDHKRLMDHIKLFLIDEVHMLKEDRGASLEAIVSRMKSAGSNVRFIALSATIPNSDDVASWLGKNSRLPNVWASRETFGEDFRPVKLQKHVRGFPPNGSNDFQFDHLCTEKLPEIISSFAGKTKPIMIFCFTRQSTETTASWLADWWESESLQTRFWNPPNKKLALHDASLRRCTLAGVAYHHGGVEQDDRKVVEDGYLAGDINVICCTSTLAAGVNLPCHLVIIKNTVCYQGAGCKEYSDLEIMQMLGRAGRPQFDRSAVAVILTKSEKVVHYDRMVSGEQVIESKLHENLVEHMNSEICLGTISSIETAKQWLRGTFFYVRLRKNPEAYRLSNAVHGATADETLQHLCEKNLSALQQFSLIASGSNFTSTEFGNIMSRYFIQFETMKTFRGIPSKAKISELLSAIAQASEFKHIRLRSSEKQTFKNINSSPSIKFPIKVDLALGPHKISLIIQAMLGGLDLRQDDRVKEKKFILADATFILQHVHRLARSIIDCQVHLEDYESTMNALELARSLAAQAWDGSPLQLGQVEGIGPVTIRKLVNAGIRTIEELENTEWQKIDMILSKNPPFGANLLSKLRSFPKLRVSLKQTEHCVFGNAQGTFIRVAVIAELGFLNESPPKSFMGLPVEICILAGTSHGHLLHFSKQPAQALRNGHSVVITAYLTSRQQLINCHAACDQIAGTVCSATLTPKVPSSMFDKLSMANMKETPSTRVLANSDGMSTGNDASNPADDFGDEVDDSLWDNILDNDNEHSQAVDENRTHQRSFAPSSLNKQHRLTGRNIDSSHAQVSAKKLPNCKWECNHKCNDKKTCKHLCCREGLDKPPKPPKIKTGQDASEGLYFTSERYKSSTVPEFFKTTNRTSPPAQVPVANSGSPRSYKQSLAIQAQTNPNKRPWSDVDLEEDDFAALGPPEEKMTPQLPIAPSKKIGFDLFLQSSSSPEKPRVLETGITLAKDGECRGTRCPPNLDDLIKQPKHKQSPIDGPRESKEIASATSPGEGNLSSALSQHDDVSNKTPQGDADCGSDCSSSSPQRVGPGTPLRENPEPREISAALKSNLGKISRDLLQGEFQSKIVHNNKRSGKIMVEAGPEDASEDMVLSRDITEWIEEQFGDMVELI